jgi:serine/threonine protein kinase
LAIAVPREARLAAPSENDVRLDGNRLLFRGVPFPGYTIEAQIGQGANGKVFRATNLLGRTEAIKVWLKLNPADNRDKIEQGTFEARKAMQASPEHAVTIHHANIFENIFFVSMEFIDGETLKNAIANLPAEIPEANFRRLALAEAYISAIRATSVDGLLHGDAHDKNVLLVPRYADGASGKQTAKLVDFGTSRLKTKRSEDYESSHWNIVNKLMHRLLRPLPRYKEIASFLLPYHQDRLTKRGDQKTGGADFYMELTHRLREELNGRGRI